MMVVRVPDEIEKNITPIIMRNMQIALSVLFVPLISPYPTVVIVVTVK